MKAIMTRALGPTAHRPARITAFDMDGNRVTIKRQEAHEVRFTLTSPVLPTARGLAEDIWEIPHRLAAEALRAKMKWRGARSLVAGGIKGGYVFVFTER